MAGALGVGRSLRRRALFHQRVHAIPMQPEQPHGQLPQVIAGRTNRQPSCPAQGVGSRFSNADGWRFTCRSRPDLFQGCFARARLSHFTRKFCEADHCWPWLAQHHHMRDGRPVCQLLPVGLMLIKFSSVAVAIIATMPARLNAICIASPSEMSSSAMWLANASRTPRQ